MNDDKKKFDFDPVEGAKPAAENIIQSGGTLAGNLLSHTPFPGNLLITLTVYGLIGFIEGTTVTHTESYNYTQHWRKAVQAACKSMEKMFYISSGDRNQNRSYYEKIEEALCDSRSYTSYATKTI